MKVLESNDERVRRKRQTNRVDFIVAITYSTIAAVAIGVVVIASMISGVVVDALHRFSLAISAAVPLGSVCLLISRGSSNGARFGVLYAIVMACAVAAHGGLVLARADPGDATTYVPAWIYLLTFALYVGFRSLATRERIPDPATSETDVAECVMKRFGQFLAWSQAGIVFSVFLDLCTNGGPIAYPALALSLSYTSLIPVIFTAVCENANPRRRFVRLSLITAAVMGALFQLGAAICTPAMRLKLNGDCILDGECATLTIRTYVSIVASAIISFYIAYCSYHAPRL